MPIFAIKGGATLLVAAVVLLVVGIVLGGPSKPIPMTAFGEQFRAVDTSELPPLSTYEGSDGTQLGYREYPGPFQPGSSVTLVHGSSASSESMHSVAMELFNAGYKVYALDIRGHGASGQRGHIDYVGQLEDDLAAFVNVVQPQGPSTFAGFSSGGGFVLRVASGDCQHLFDSYLMLSPFLGQDSPSQRLNSGGWVHVGVPRIIALSLLNAVGLRSFNSLPVTEFALDERAGAMLTPWYDYNLAVNFRPRSDYMSDLRNVKAPSAILAGTDDEAFFAEKFEGIVREAGQNWDVWLLAKVGHISLTLDPKATQAATLLVSRLQHGVVLYTPQ